MSKPSVRILEQTFVAFESDSIIVCFRGRRAWIYFALLYDESKHHHRNQVIKISHFWPPNKMCEIKRQRKIKGHDVFLSFLKDWSWKQEYDSTNPESDCVSPLWNYNFFRFMILVTVIQTETSTVDHSLFRKISCLPISPLFVLKDIKIIFTHDVTFH